MRGRLRRPNENGVGDDAAQYDDGRPVGQRRVGARRDEEREVVLQVEEARITAKVKVRCRRAEQHGGDQSEPEDEDGERATP